MSSALAAVLLPSCRSVCSMQPSPYAKLALICRGADDSGVIIVLPLKTTAQGVWTSANAGDTKGICCEHTCQAAQPGSTASILLQALAPCIERALHDSHS